MIAAGKVATKLTEPALDGRYRLIQPLGKGATSLVLEAEDLHQPGLRRAVKVLQKGASEPLLRAEFARLSRMRHANLVRVHDLGRVQKTVRLDGEEPIDAGRLYLVMDLVDGLGPSEALRRSSTDQRDGLLRRIARDLAQALAHVHAHGLVHHDVKPENLLLDGDGRAILLDLGLATIQRREPGSLAGRGTLPYMAPEGLMGGGDHRVDLYGMGATLFHLAAGHPPFAGTGATLVRRILDQPPELPSPGWLAPATGALILQLLQKDPLDRPGSARTVLAELARMEGDQDAVAELVARPELMPPAFVGRQDLVDDLLRRIEQVGPRVLLVVGEPGSGKTRLVDEVIRHQRIGEAAGLRPRRELARDLEASDRGTVDERVLAWLERVERRDDREPPPVLVRLTLDGETGPLARRLIEVLLTEQESLPVTALVEAEPEDPVVEEDRAGRLHRVDLKPLTRAQTTRLVGSMLSAAGPPEIGKRVHRLSRGNPGLAVELTRLYHEQGEEGLDLTRVAGLEAAVARGRQRMNGQQRRVMDALAVWGVPASVGDLATLSGLPVETLWQEVDGLAQRGRLQLGPSDRLQLHSRAHVEAWRRVLAAAEPDGARELHARAARMLAGDEGADNGLPRRAEHELAAATPGARRTALRAATEMVRDGRGTAAIPILRQVVAMGEGPGDPVSAEATPQLARLLIATGEYDEALGLLSDGGQALERAELLQKRGDFVEAEALLQRLLPKLSGDERARCGALLARLLLGRGRPAEAQAVADPLLEEHGDLPALLEAAGLSRIYLGDLDGARRIFERGAREVQGSSDQRGLARMLSLQAMVAFSAGQNEVAAGLYARALELAAGVGDVHGRATYRASLGAVQLRLGRLGEALVSFTRVVRDLARLARTAELASPLCNLTNLLLLLGDLESAERTLARIRAEASRLGSQHTTGFAELLQGDLHRRRGRAGEAVQRYRRARDIFAQTKAREIVDCELSLAAVVAPSEAVGLLRALWEAQADRRGEVALAWARLLADGAVADSRAPSELEDALVRHCVDLEAQGARVDLWRTATVLGIWLARRGQPGARGVLSRARRTWEEIVKETPEVYRERMAEDPDALSLFSEWQALLAEEGPETAPS